MASVYQLPPIENFGLTAAQQEAIHTQLLDPIFLGKEAHFKNRTHYLKAIYNPNANDLKILQTVLKEKEIRDLTMAATNPERVAEAFGIPLERGSLIAFRTYVRSALGLQMNHFHTPYNKENVERYFRAKMSHTLHVDHLPALTEIPNGPALKYKLKVKGPVLPVLPKNPSTIDYILHHTYCADIRPRDGQSVTDKQVSDHITKGFTELYKNKELSWLLDCYAGYLKTTGKGGIFLGESVLYNDFSKEYGEPGDGAFYNGKSSIFNCGIINPREPNRRAYMAPIIHELTHLLINHIFKNFSSPTFTSEDEFEYDKLLAADREHRKQNGYHYQSNIYTQIKVDGSSMSVLRDRRLDRIQFDVEESQNYFPPNGFDPIQPEHRRTMRKEMVTKIPELLCLYRPECDTNYSLEDIGKWAPNLVEDFQKRIKPALMAKFLNSKPKEDSKESS